MNGFVALYIGLTALFQIKPSSANEITNKNPNVKDIGIFV
jgi:hypothetical protein